MKSKNLIGITLVVLGLIVGGTYFFLLQAKTVVTGVETKWNIDAGRIIRDRITISPAKNRKVELQEYDSKGKTWVTRKTFRTKGRNVTKLTVVFPRNWADRTYTTWRIHLPQVLGARGYDSEKIRITAMNLRFIEGLNTKAAVIMDMKTKQVIYGQNMHQRLPNASTTKMMTAIVSMSRATGSERVRFTKEVVDTPEGLMWKKRGDIFLMSDLWKAMLIMSCNDAAAGVAYGTTGDISTFVNLMNRTAGEMGLKDTHFMNPHGMDTAGHYSSAYDLALIDRRAMDFAAFRKIVRMQKYQFRALNHPERINYITTTNDLLKKNIPGYLGGKTGTTYGAGDCYAGVYEYKGRKYITVVLNAKNRWKATRKLYSYIRTSGVR